MRRTLEQLVPLRRTGLQRGVDLLYMLKMVAAMSGCNYGVMKPEGTVCTAMVF